MYTQYFHSKLSAYLFVRKISLVIFPVLVFKCAREAILCQKLDHCHRYLDQYFPGKHILTKTGLYFEPEFNLRMRITPKQMQKKTKYFHV